MGKFRHYRPTCLKAHRKSPAPRTSFRYLPPYRSGPRGHSAASVSPLRACGSPGTTAPTAQCLARTMKIAWCRHADTTSMASHEIRTDLPAKPVEPADAWTGKGDEESGQPACPYGRRCDRTRYSKRSRCRPI